MNERSKLHGARFPSGFQRLSNATRCNGGTLTGLPKSYYPRAPKDGEHLIRVDVDPNGVAHERGDIILSLAIRSQSIPNLIGDWEVVQAKPRFERGHQDNPYHSRYMLVKAAKPADAAACRELSEATTRAVMDQMMNS